MSVVKGALEDMTVKERQTWRDLIGADVTFCGTGRVVAVGSKTVSLSYSSWDGETILISFPPDSLLDMPND